MIGRRLSVLHVLPTRAKEYGGPVAVAESMAEEAIRQGVTVHMYPPLPSERRGLPVYQLACQVRRADLIHIHGLWSVTASLAATIARVSGVPYIITPHGMLDRWALARSCFKKRIYGWLIERRNLRGAAAVQFLNEEELFEARAYGVPLRSFVLGNGVFVEQFRPMPAPETLLTKFPHLQGKTLVLFLGRLHPKKGFDLLLPAFRQAGQIISSLHLVVAGPDENGYRARIEQDIQRLRMESQVTFLGMVSGDMKLHALAAADFFVLPSHQEGDSVAVKEAMACGLPVLITPACHFQEVDRLAAGKVISADVSAWAQAIIDLARDPTLRRSMGERGRQFVHEEHTWARVVFRLLSEYRHVLENRTMAGRHDG